jgi:hypothetical protein
MQPTLHISIENSERPPRMSSGALYHKVTTARVYGRRATVTERHPEVAQLEGSLARNEDVIGFGVAMDDSM